MRDLRAPRDDTRAGPGGKARAGLRETRVGSARSRARDRKRLGGVRDVRRQDPRLPCHDYDDLAPAARVRARAGPPGGLGGQGHGADGRLPGAAWPLRQAGVDRDDRGGRLAAARRLLRRVLSAAGGRRGDAAAGDHDRRPRLRGRESLEIVHEQLHLPRRVSALARGDHARARHANGYAGHRPRRPHRTLRRNASALAERGYDERFRRIWTLYLAYCEAGFAERRICDIQLLLTKPSSRLTSGERAGSRDRIGPHDLAASA